jgi:hypothetical protein
LPNGDIFKKAISERRIVLTFDLDFGEIVASSGSQRASVILFRLHNTRTPYVIERLRKVLRDSHQVLEQGAIIVVEESRHRMAVFSRDLTNRARRMHTVLICLDPPAQLVQRQ